MDALHLLRHPLPARFLRTVQQKVPFPFGIVLPFFIQVKQAAVCILLPVFPTRNVGSSTIPSFQLLSSFIRGRTSSVITFPNPEHSGHMPPGLLKEKQEGVPTWGSPIRE